MNLIRPLVFFDLETTGTDVSNDRIVEFGAIKIYPDSPGNVKNMTGTMHYRINPGIPIPPSATAVHGITDEDVKDKPTFSDLSFEILSFFLDSDIAGFNCLKFDLPLLYTEFHRAGINWHYKNHKLIDVRNIFIQKESRDLSSAVKFYLNKDLENAHGAIVDTAATIEVFKAQLEKYQDLPQTIEELEIYSNYGNKILDLKGSFKYNADNEIVFNFGKHKDKLAIRERSYLEWMLKSDFPEDTKDIIRGLLK